MCTGVDCTAYRGNSCAPCCTGPLVSLPLYHLNALPNTPTPKGAPARECYLPDNQMTLPCRRNHRRIAHKKSCDGHCCPYSLKNRDVHKKVTIRKASTVCDESYRVIVYHNSALLSPPCPQAQSGGTPNARRCCKYRDRIVARAPL